ncbi:hypothetical protein [Mesorhizobium sp. CN2-181]|uniref:hypothetical protein n=1 Tax=Mesorhizobium yinganensis TaxID=3157707 RepID=UPI0032B875DC
MLDAIWHVRGGVLILGDRSEHKIIQRFASIFAAHCKPVVQTTELSVEFCDPWWRFFTSRGAGDFSRKEHWKGLSPLGIFDRGKIMVTKTDQGKVLRYDIRILHGLVFSVLGSIVLGIIALVGGVSTSSAGILSIFAFLWLYLPASLWVSFRARTFFHKTVADIR